MPHTFSVDAIVLATYNVGEADRFCVLFTRERGRIAARAIASRKPGSKIGGLLLPQRRVRIDLREWSNGYVIAGAQTQMEPSDTGSLSQFLVRAEIAEVLLLLLHDGEAHAELFECVVQAMQRCSLGANPAIVRILHLLGHFPEETAEHFSALSEEDRSTITLWASGTMEAARTLSPRGHLCISTLCASVLEEHGNGKRKAPIVCGAMAT